MANWTVEALKNNKLTAQTKKCATVLSKRCKMIAKWKKSGLKALEKFKKIYESKGKEGKKKDRSPLTRSNLKNVCSTVYNNAYNLFQNNTKAYGSYCGNINIDSLKKKQSIESGSKVLSEDKNLIESMNEVLKYCKYLHAYDIPSIILAATTLEVLNSKLNAGLKTITESYSTLANKSHSAFSQFNSETINNLFEVRSNATKIMSEKSELLDFLEKSEASSKTLLDGIFANYSEIRDCGKSMNASYDSLESSISIIKKEKPDVFNELELADFIKKDDISNFLPEVKKIKNAAIKVNGGNTEKFDLRSLESARNLPIKMFNRCISSVIKFLNGKTEKFDTSCLDINKTIDNVNSKLETIKDTQYNENSITGDINEARIKAEKWFASKPKASKIEFDIEKDAKKLNHETVKSTVTDKLGPASDIGTTLKELADEAKEDKVYYLALIEKMSSDLSKTIIELKKQFDGMFTACDDLVKQIKLGGSKLKRILGRIQPITGAIATIGCFAGFAMSCICPAVGWVIFGVCVAAFTVNLGTAIYRAASDLHSRHKKRSDAI